MRSSIEEMQSKRTQRRIPFASLWLTAALGLGVVPRFAPGAELSERSPSFRTDVMAVLSKAGCNLGVCHGNKNGKGGFKLSLRGEDPVWDFSVLSHDMRGRRINPLEPEQSL